LAAGFLAVVVSDFLVGAAFLAGAFVVALVGALVAVLAGAFAGAFVAVAFVAAVFATLDSFDSVLGFGAAVVFFAVAPGANTSTILSTV